MNEAPPMMRCGHAANATMEVAGEHLPVCAICHGIVSGADEVGDPPDLAGRFMRCPQCGTERPSDQSGAFFESRPGRETDSFYCGCRGWD